MNTWLRLIVAIRTILPVTALILLSSVSPQLLADNFGGYDFQLNGSAQIVDSGNTLRLTEALNGQAGSAFISTPFALNANTDFSAFFAFNIRDSEFTGADGLTFTVHADAAGAAALGNSGFDLGYTGITPSIAVEVDTWENDHDPVFDPPTDHLGLNSQGSVWSHVTFEPGFSLEDGTTYYVWYDYVSENPVINFYFNTARVKPAVPDIRLASPGLDLALGPQVYLGFTGATGGDNNIHDIEEFELHWGYIPPPLGTAPIPATSPWSALLLILLMAGLAGVVIRHRRQMT